jgi:hypothetical protein
LAAAQATPREISRLARPFEPDAAPARALIADVVDREPLRPDPAKR